jgi:nitrilase
MTGIIPVAIAQVEPVYLDVRSSLEKAISCIEKAAAQGAKLIVFGETWLAGYPAWLDYCPNAALWDSIPVKEVYARMRQNSVIVPGPETDELGRAAADLDITVAMGINERVDSGPGNGTLYNTLLVIDSTGTIVSRHRKLVPTYTERMIWGMGEGGGLEAVSTKAGRIGGLICWEHWMPLARQVLHMSGEEIHVAVWPTVHDVHQLASRHYAFEGRCFVLAAGLLMRVKHLPVELDLPSHLHRDSEEWLLRGGSAIIGPDGKYVAGPVFEMETILTAELDLSANDREKMTLDVTGHYNRPDLFHLEFRKPQ